MATNITSTEIKIALAQKHAKDFFLTEVKSGSTWFTPVGDMKILDALAIRKSWSNPCFTGYEVKVSRGDFLRDAKFYTYEELCNCLYIICPKGLIERTELPESIGLMYYDPVTKAITTRKKAIYRKIEYSPDLLRYIIYSRLDSDRYPFFSSKKDYFDSYLAGKINNRILSHEVKSALIASNVQLEQELEKLREFQRHYEEYEQIKEVLKKHAIYGWRAKDHSVATELDEALSRACPKDISTIKETLQDAIRRIERMEESARTNAGEPSAEDEGTMFSAALIG